MFADRIRSLALSAALLSTAAAGAVAVAAPAQAAVRIGGVDVARACATQHVFGSVARYSNYNNPYSWYCAAPNWPYYSLGGVDMNRACADQYGRGASAGLAARNVFGWYCQR